MTIEGLHEFELVRDFLYSKMRGVRHAPVATGSHPVVAPAASNDLAAALREVSAELRGVREALERRRS
jgi:putative membrane protein